MAIGRTLNLFIMESLLNWITANQQIIYIVILMIFVGIEVIGRVPSVLHTPLMSGANAIHGVGAPLRMSVTAPICPGLRMSQ